MSGSINLYLKIPMPDGKICGYRNEQHRVVRVGRLFPNKPTAVAEGIATKMLEQSPNQISTKSLGKVSKELKPGEALQDSKRVKLIEDAAKLGITVDPTTTKPEVLKLLDDAVAAAELAEGNKVPPEIPDEDQTAETPDAVQYPEAPDLPDALLLDPDGGQGEPVLTEGHLDPVPILKDPEPLTEEPAVDLTTLKHVELYHLAKAADSAAAKYTLKKPELIKIIEAAEKAAAVEVAG